MWWPRKYRRFLRGTEKYLYQKAAQQVFQGKKAGDKILRILMIIYQYKEKEPYRINRQPKGQVKRVLSSEDLSRGKIWLFSSDLSELGECHLRAFSPGNEIHQPVQDMCKLSCWQGSPGHSTRTYTDQVLRSLTSGCEKWIIHTVPLSNSSSGCG